MTARRLRALGIVLLAILVPGRARALPTVAINATVSNDLASISGYLLVTDPERIRFIDPMAYLQVPEDDLQMPRTYPGAPESGWVHFERIDEGLYWFYAIMPRRYGDTGSIRGRGLFANGGWYPQPILAGGAPVVQWRVTLQVPAGTVGAVGDRAGEDVVRWTGLGERASLAVVPRGRLTAIVGTGTDLTLLTRGPPRRHLVQELRGVFSEAHPPGETLRGVVVEAPLRRRLARPGLGMAYVSDRAFRVSPGLSRFHRVAVARGVLAGLLDVPEPFARGLAAAATSEDYRRGIEGPDARGLLRFGAWVPTIDALLYDRRMPFVADVFEEVHPGDPIADDLLERIDRRGSPIAAMEQIRAGWGEVAHAAVADALRRGTNIEEASILAGVPVAWLRSWRAGYPPQDYALDVDAHARAITVARRATDSAPAEVVVVEIDGRSSSQVIQQGPGTLAFTADRDPSRVRLDPDGLLRQTSHLGDTWPEPLTVTASAWIDELNLTHFSLSGAAAMWMRRRHDTHNIGALGLFTDRENLAGATVTYVRQEGALQDGRNRPHRVSVWVSPALLDPGFAPTESGDVALGTGVSYGWDTRVSRLFPLRGHDLTLGTDGGFVPGSTSTWAAVRGSATGVASVHPRLAAAARVSAGLAAGDVDHRLLALGGSDALRCLPPSLAIGTRRATGALELRAAPVRGASVPVGFAWGTELQLTAGAELGTAWVDATPVHAAGVTAGLAVVGDVLGFQPEMMGVTAAWPMWVEGVDLPAEDRHLPEISLRWWQEF